MTMNVFSVLLIVLLLASFDMKALGATTDRHRVDYLPGWGAPPTATYTGFVEVDAASETHLFFSLVESQGDPLRDPIVWWHNGGPGASSFAGLFSENGPLLLNASTETGEYSLMKNPYAWNLNANLLAVEYGPGIGYSYCANSSFSETLDCKAADRAKGLCTPCWSSDSSVSTQLSVFLETLLTKDGLFPHFAGKDLYLAGESYAGVYVTTLAEKLLKNNADTSIVNLRGIWITDPCLSNDAQHGWLDLSPDFALEKGLISRSTHNAIIQCTAAKTKVGDRVRRTDSSKCRSAWRVYDLATGGLGDAVHPAPIPGLSMYIDPLNAYGFSGGADLPSYLGSQSMRESLGASTSKNKNYMLEIGNNGYPQYTLEYAACNNAASDDMRSMIDVYQSIFAMSRSGSKSAANLTQIVIVNGDIDPVIDMHGTEKTVEAFGFPEVSTEPRRPWFFNSTRAPRGVLEAKPLAWGPTLTYKDAGAQVGGFVRRFDTNSSAQLRFVTVRASGEYCFFFCCIMRSIF